MEKDEFYNQRVEKAAQLRSEGVPPYAKKYERTHTTARVSDDFDALSESEATVCVAGRMTAVRRMGKASFVDITDDSGKIQAYFKMNNMGEEKYEIFKKLDIGDILGVQGKVFKTRTGEVTVVAEDFTLLTKMVLTAWATKTVAGFCSIRNPREIVFVQPGRGHEAYGAYSPR